MSNSKIIATRRKHRRKKRAAKTKLREHLAGKIEADKLPALARACLIRYLRVGRRG